MVISIRNYQLCFSLIQTFFFFFRKKDKSYATESTLLSSYSLKWPLIVILHNVQNHYMFALLKSHFNSAHVRISRRLPITNEFRVLYITVIIWPKLIYKYNFLGHLDNYIYILHMFYLKIQCRSWFFTDPEMVL